MAICRQEGSLGEKKRRYGWEQVERRMGKLIRGGVEWEHVIVEAGAGWRRDGGHQSRPPIAARDRARRHWGTRPFLFCKGDQNFPNLAGCHGSLPSNQLLPRRVQIRM